VYSPSTWAEYFRFHAVLIGVSRTGVVATIDRLATACGVVGLSTEAIDDVMGSLFGYSADTVAASLLVLSASDLRYAILADCYQIARGAKIESPESDPTLRRLARALNVSSEQQRALAWYAWACDTEHDNPWRDQLKEITFALGRVREVGVPIVAVTDAPRVCVPGIASYWALVRLCGDVLSR
jgi:hypothetical protein